MVNENLVYIRIGMALVSAQRVEAIASDIFEHLKEFDSTTYGLTTSDFLAASNKSKKARKTLGEIFKFLKLNPKLVIENELDQYVKLRNILAHQFFKTYLNSKSQQQMESGIIFCNEFGKMSEKLEAFFKGFIYFLALRHVDDVSKMPDDLKEWENNFDYFIDAIRRKNFKD